MHNNWETLSSLLGNCQCVPGHQDSVNACQSFQNLSSIGSHPSKSCYGIPVRNQPPRAASLHLLNDQLDGQVGNHGLFSSSGTDWDAHKHHTAGRPSYVLYCIFGKYIHICINMEAGRGEVQLPPSIDDIPSPGMGLVEELDKLLMIQLRDGRKLIGIMRSFDQFANIVLEGTCVPRAHSFTSHETH